MARDNLGGLVSIVCTAEAEDGEMLQSVPTPLYRDTVARHLHRQSHIAISESVVPVLVQDPVRIVPVQFDQTGVPQSGRT